MAQQDLKKALERKGGLTLAQLASYDDVLTDALVDRVSPLDPSVPLPARN
jgi:histone-lysine N-methyltransferase SUV420H